MKKYWFSLSSSEVLAALSTSRDGLLFQEAHKRQSRFGKNQLPKKRRMTRLRVFFAQFQNALVIILMIAGLISLALGERIDALVIGMTVLINAVIGYVQEYKAQDALQKLQEVISLHALVIREGKEYTIAAEDLVPGDTVRLRAGDTIPADGRLLQIKNFQVNEANLTGESLSVTKNIRLISNLKTPLPDRENMVFAGTSVTRGSAYAVVTEIGAATEMGKIAKLLQSTEDETTPLQKRLLRFSRWIGILCLVLVMLILAIGLLRGIPFTHIFLTAVAVAVAAVPEGLVLSVTVILAIGMQRILKRNGLVRRLSSTETLGSTSVICTDKTGTLTEGNMKAVSLVTASGVQNVEQPGEGSLDLDMKKTLLIALLSNDVIVEGDGDDPKDWKLTGTPTEKALLLAAAESGLQRKQMLSREPRLDVLPFDSVRKYYVSLHRLRSKEHILYFSGAPEKLLALSAFFLRKGKEVRVTSENLRIWQKEQEALSRKGLRLIAVGYKKVPSTFRSLQENAGKNIIGAGMTFVGMLALRDVLRSGAKQTIQRAWQAGIRTVMITGDHRITAQTIASELGMKTARKNVIDGEELAAMSERQLHERVQDITVYARVSPEDKLRIIRAWQKRGEVVAMTGDGINDAPALKAADVGVAVGSGTDVTKETADIVLLDNNFQTIVSAVEEGRTIFENIRKVMLYLLSDSFLEIVLVGGAILVGLPLPVNAAQILWVNLIEDSLPSVALAFENGETALMKQKPRKLRERLLDKEMRFYIFLIAMINNVLLFGLYLYYQSVFDLSYTRSIVFTALALNSIFFVFSCRSFRVPLWKKGLFSNRHLLLAVLYGVLFLLFALYVPFFQNLLRTEPLGISEWIPVIILAGIPVIVIECIKWVYNRRKIYS